MRLSLLALSLAAASCAAVEELPPLTPKTTLQLVDAGVETACRGLAQRLAAKGGADARAIIDATCAVEGFTRSFREMLLSQQIEAARRAGVEVPDVNSGAFEDEDAAAAGEALPAE